MRMMVLVLCASLIAGAASAGGDDVLTMAELKGYFQRVAADNGRLSLTFKDKGRRFVYRINGGDLQKSGYGDSIQLAQGDTLELIEHGGALTFSNLPGALKVKGFALKQIKDERSVGGQVKASGAYLLLTPPPAQPQAQAAAKAAGDDVAAGVLLVAPSAEAVKAAVGK